jgi:hypothetical protein
MSSGSPQKIGLALLNPGICAKKDCLLSEEVFEIFLNIFKAI